MNNFGKLFLRIAVSLFMLPHGIQKISMLSSGKIEFLNPVGLGQETSLIIAMLAETCLSVFLILGLFTRISATLLCINMAVAMCALHQIGKGWSNGLELPALYFVVYFAILILGGGKISVGQMIGKEDF